jgi:hypothetical protein
MIFKNLVLQALRTLWNRKNTIKYYMPVYSVYLVMYFYKVEKLRRRISELTKISGWLSLNKHHKPVKKTRIRRKTYILLSQTV